jgi:hypothetical protein
LSHAHFEIRPAIVTAFVLCTIEYTYATRKAPDDSLNRATTSEKWRE